MISVWLWKEQNKQVKSAFEGPKFKKRDQVEDDNGHYDTILSVNKQRENGWEGRIGLYFDVDSQQFHDEDIASSINYYDIIGLSN